MEQIEAIKRENQEIADDKNRLQDEFYELESKIDVKNDEIAQLKIEMQRNKDALDLKKEVENSLSQNLLKHED